MAKTSLGLDENIAGVLCYVLAWISGIVMFLLEEENKSVRFHAIQSVLVFGILNLAALILGWLPAVGGFFVWAIGVIAVILWLVLMVKAYQGEKYKLPWAGDFAEKRAR